jgi:hypothetical protein
MQQHTRSCCYLPFTLAWATSHMVKANIFSNEKKCYMSFIKYMVEQRVPLRFKATYAKGTCKDTTSLVLPPGINFQFASQRVHTRVPNISWEIFWKSCTVLLVHQVSPWGPNSSSEYAKAHHANLFPDVLIYKRVDTTLSEERISLCFHPLNIQKLARHTEFEFLKALDCTSLCTNVTCFHKIQLPKLVPFIPLL